MRVLGAGDARHNSGHSVRSIAHAATTILLSLAVVVLVLQVSGERALRRQADARMTQLFASRPQVPRLGQRSTSWPMTTPHDLRALSPRTVASQAAVTSAAVAAANSGSHPPDGEQQLREQLSDPAMRSALRGQQRSAVLQLYGELLRSWHLSAGKSDQLLDLLAEQQLQEMDRALAQSIGATTGVQPPGNSDELNALLTEQQGAQLTKQQATLSERMTISALADELSLAQMPLTDSQRDQLTQIMYDERLAVPAPDVQGSAANSPDARRALADWQSALEQRVQDRAATILSSAQQTRYEQFMGRQREARNAFASFEVVQSGDNAGGAAPPSATVPPQGP